MGMLLVRNTRRASRTIALSVPYRQYLSASPYAGASYSHSSVVKDNVVFTEELLAGIDGMPDDSRPIHHGGLPCLQQAR